MPKLVQTGSSRRADRFIAALIKRVVFCVARPIGASHDRQRRLDGLLRFDQIRATHGGVGIDAVSVDDPAVEPALKPINCDADVVLNLVRGVLPLWLYSTYGHLSEWCFFEVCRCGLRASDDRRPLAMADSGRRDLLRRAARTSRGTDCSRARKRTCRSPKTRRTTTASERNRD